MDVGGRSLTSSPESSAAAHAGQHRREGMAARIRRQSRLTDNTPLELPTVVSEAALHRTLGDAGVRHPVSGLQTRHPALAAPVERHPSVPALRNPITCYFG